MRPQLHHDTLTRVGDRAVTAARRVRETLAARRLTDPVPASTPSRPVTALSSVAIWLVPPHIVPVPPCLPADFGRLFVFLDRIAHLLLFGGIAIATPMLLIGSILVIGPFGADGRRRGIQIIKYTLFGLILLLSAQLIVSWIVGQLAPVFCPR